MLSQPAELKTRPGHWHLQGLKLNSCTSRSNNDHVWMQDAVVAGISATAESPGLHLWRVAGLHPVGLPRPALDFAGAARWTMTA